MPFLVRAASLVWTLLAALLTTLGLSGCDGGPAGRGSQATDQAASAAAVAARPEALGPQPTLDSTYVIQVMRATPQFREQELPARRFYRARNFALGWFHNHQVVPQAQHLLELTAKAADEGLDPKDYQIKNIAKLLSDLKSAAGDSVRRNQLERDTDLALTGTYLVWASDYYRGIANPHDKKDASWRVKPNKIKLHKALLTFLGERKSRYNYYEFAPLHPEYEQLKKALAAYRAQEKAGGWPALPAALKLKPGQASPAVPLLRQRLLGAAAPTATAAAPGADSAGKPAAPGAAAAPASTYGPDLVQAVKSFQADAGLTPDGIVGGETLKQLNVPIGDRIDQIVLNMERWRWLPKKFEPNYLLVNIPEYKLRMVEGGKQVFTMRVIVGKTLNATPIFSDRMEYVVLSPYWNVPFSIIDKELRPKLVNNPNYLDRLDMEVVKGSGRKATPVDPASVDWANVTQETFKYTLRRRPGPKNDLGEVKFIFPNADDIYLHDTPHDELFSQAQRNFSHGCVRVQEPVKLAAYLLRNRPEWSRTAIVDTIARRREKYVPLKEKLPVYLVYFTAWADSTGRPHFRNDIYGHDKALAREYFN